MKEVNGKFKTQTFSIGQAAKLIDFPGGRQKFYNWLRTKNFILSDNFPSQSMMDRGWLKVAKVIGSDEGALLCRAVPRVTVQGIAGLEKIRLKEFPICEPCK